MENKYNLVINAAIKILNSFIMFFGICFAIIVYLNTRINISKVWNICFLIPMIVLALASIIQLVICFWRTGKVNGSEERVASRKSGLIFSSSITFLVFISNFIAYIVFSIILL